jgi:hypothetical protein
MTIEIYLYTVNREVFAAQKVGEFAFFQLAVDKIPRLLQNFNGYGYVCANKRNKGTLHLLEM